MIKLHSTQLSQRTLAKGVFVVIDSIHSKATMQASWRADLCILHARPLLEYLTSLVIIMTVSAICSKVSNDASVRFQQCSWSFQALVEYRLKICKRLHWPLHRAFCSDALNLFDSPWSKGLCEQCSFIEGNEILQEEATLQNYKPADSAASICPMDASQAACCQGSCCVLAMDECN